MSIPRHGLTRGALVREYPSGKIGRVIHTYKEAEIRDVLVGVRLEGEKEVRAYAVADLLAAPGGATNVAGSLTTKP